MKPGDHEFSERVRKAFAIKCKYCRANNLPFAMCFLRHVRTTDCASVGDRGRV